MKLVLFVPCAATAEGDTALLAAVVCGNLAVVKVLLAKGASPNLGKTQ